MQSCFVSCCCMTLGPFSDGVILQRYLKAAFMTAGIPFHQNCHHDQNHAVATLCTGPSSRYENITMSRPRTHAYESLARTRMLAVTGTLYNVRVFA